MDTRGDAERRFHGPHLPTTVRRQMPATMKEIESATTEFLRAADDLIQDLSPRSAERVWICSRIAWGILFPYRRSVLRSQRSLLEAFRDSVTRVREALRSKRHPKDEFLEYLQDDLSRRESLLNALLSDNSETRIREWLAAEKHRPE